MSDEINDEIEHQVFLDHLNRLAEQVFWAYRNPSLGLVHEGYADIKTFGDEPIFASLLFEKMIAESEAE